MKISFESKSPKTDAVVAFASDGGKLLDMAQAIDKKTKGALKRAIAAEQFTGKKGQTLVVAGAEGVSHQHVVLLGLGKAEDLKVQDFEKLGSSLISLLNQKKAGSAEVAFADVPVKKGVDAADVAAAMAQGALLSAYRFDKYLTKEPKDKKPTLKSITFTVENPAKAKKVFADAEKVAAGVYLTRDLVSEAPNVLYPEEFARRASRLRKVGVGIDVLDVKAMTKLGMGALLGVGQGSSRPSRTVIMRWNGGKKGEPPVAFVGKGVCFDTGGISIKSAGGMEEMKGDMGGAACVVGLMHALAARKAKVNAIGAIGLVENMPDGNAQRPGDIVTSMSGQTIEIINTDAEGRLVLADVLWYVAKKFKPKFMVDLATLTGAIMVALGTEHAGLFSNNDQLSERLTKVGAETGERVWRMPLAPEYDKLIDSQFADMKNTGGRYGGSITAAQFLQRFVDDTPWAHLDIAGTAMGAPKTDINQSWGSGFGVRLLDRLVAEYYEARR